MNKLSRLVCISTLFAAAAMPAAAVAGGPPAAMGHADGRHYVPLATACPDALKELPDNLYQAWREIDSAAEVVVDFNLDGHKITRFTMSGVHASHIGPVRRAVKAIKCGHAGEQGRAVRFRITFQYPEDQKAAATAMQFFDEAPTVAALQGGTSRY